MTPPLDLAAARAVCEKAPEDIEMVDTNDHHYGYGSATHEPSKESRAFYEAARSLLPAALSEIETLRAHLTNVLNIGDILIEAAERDGDMSDEEVSGCRGRAAEVFAQLRTLLHPTEVSR